MLLYCIESGIGRNAKFLLPLINKKAPLTGGGWEQGKCLCLMRVSQDKGVRKLVTAFSALSIVS